MKNPNNKFYVASPHMVNDVSGYRTSTFNSAVTKAENRIHSEGLDEVLIVKVVGIVRKQDTPVKVVKLK